MDLKNLDFKAIFNTALSLLTKLLVGLGVFESEEDAPYKPYLDSAMNIIDAVVNATKE